MQKLISASRLIVGRARICSKRSSEWRPDDERNDFVGRRAATATSARLSSRRAHFSSPSWPPPPHKLALEISSQNRRLDETSMEWPYLCLASRSVRYGNRSKRMESFSRAQVDPTTTTTNSNGGQLSYSITTCECESLRSESERAPTLLRPTRSRDRDTETE